MFERFTDDSRRVVIIAREAAERSGADRVRPAHLLLGVAEAGGPAADAFRGARVDPADLRRLLSGGTGDGRALDADALAVLGIDLESVRTAAEEVFGAGALDDPPRPGRTGRPRFSDAAKESLQQALRSALRRGDRHLDSGHVLRGVLAVGDPEIGDLLRRLGVSADELRWHLPRRWAA